MLCACIDIGSNTTRVLVADVDAAGIRPVLERKAYTELGRDLRATGAVSEARMRDLARVVGEYRRTVEALGVRRLRTVATAAVEAVRTPGTELDGVAVAGSRRGVRGLWVELRHRRRHPSAASDAPEATETGVAART